VSNDLNHFELSRVTINFDNKIRIMDTNESIQRLAEFSSEIREITLKRLEEVPDGFINWRLNNTFF
jgi:hypothetical protein